MSAHSNVIDTSLTWSQEDAAKYFLQPLFISNNDLSHFDVITNISGSSIKLDKYTALKGVTGAIGAGCFDGQDKQSTNSNVTLDLVRLEVEHAQKAQSLFNHIKSQLMRQGIDRNDLDGTLLMQMISELLMGGIMRDFSTILWWGNGSSGSGVQGLNAGIWNKVFETTANGGIPATSKVTYSPGATAAIDALEALMLARTNELAASDQVMFVSRSFADKYKNELYAQGVNNAYADMQSGIENLSYNGIPMVVKPDFDVNIAEFHASMPTGVGSAADKTECAMLLAKDAIAVGTDFEIQDVDMWYNRDCKENRFRMNYSVGVALKDGALAATVSH